MQDHRIILRAVDVLQHMAESEQIDPGDAGILLGFLRTFVDEHHHIKEESALFPEVMKTSQAQGGSLRDLLFEHDQERSLVNGLEEALRTKKRAEFAFFVNRITAGIRNHIRKEDGILFPMLEGLLSGSQDDKVVAEFEKFHVDLGFISDLGRLERKYLARTS